MALRRVLFTPGFQQIVLWLNGGLIRTECAEFSRTILARAVRPSSEFRSHRTSPTSSPETRRREHTAKKKLENHSKNIFMRDMSPPVSKPAAIPPTIFSSQPAQLAGCVCQNTARKNSRTK